MINGIVYRDMIISASNAVNNDKEKINRLNVFPVPDGDTGINMGLTLLSAKNNIGGFTGSISDCADMVASSLLRGARGNSGVILSLFFRGISKTLHGMEEADIPDFAAALKNGVTTVYGSVRQPTEGTVLTVMRLSADKAEEISEDCSDFKEFFRIILETAEETLANTPELLPVLKKSKVVDAGGMGFVTALKGMKSVIDGNGIIPTENETQDTNEENSIADFEGFDTKDIKYAYCTECIVDKKEDITENDIREFENTVMNAGDSNVFVNDTDIIKVHVHTNDPGKVLSAAVKCGSLPTIKVENMKLQHSAIISKKPEEEKPKETIAKPEKDYGFVCVAAGDGFANLFKELGADMIVSGGQTMNPSTDDIVKAALSCPAKTVYVFPNNKNIYMAAKQAVDLVHDREIIVIRTVSMPQCITAMLTFDPEADKDENTENMTEAMKGLSEAEITYAARDSVFGDVNIREGQLLCVSGGNILAANTIEECISLLAPIVFNKSCVTLYYGCDVSEEEAEKTSALLKKELSSDTEIVTVRGGQPVYYYIISGE